MQNKHSKSELATYLRKVAAMVRETEAREEKEAPKVISLARALQLLGAKDE